MNPVIANRVDDKNALNNRAVVAPGAHKVTLDLPPRYYVAARLESPTLQEWQPVVRYSEPIGECRAKFNVVRGTK